MGVNNNRCFDGEVKPDRFEGKSLGEEAARIRGSAVCETRGADVIRFVIDHYPNGAHLLAALGFGAVHLLQDEAVFCDKSVGGGGEGRFNHAVGFVPRAEKKKMRKNICIWKESEKT